MERKFLKMSDVEYMSVAVFVGRSATFHNPKRNTLLDSILFRVEEFRNILFSEKEDVNGKYYKHIDMDILRWIAYGDRIPRKWSACWRMIYSKSMGYDERYHKYADPENEDFKRVRACAAAYLEQIDNTATQAEETRASVLRMHRNKELDTQITPVLNLRELQREGFTANDCRQFCYYGYMMGVRAERKRRRRAAQN